MIFVKLIEVKHEIICYGDSELVVKQVNGIYAIKTPHIGILNTLANLTISELKMFKLIHVLRQYNKVADKLSNDAIILSVNSIAFLY